MSSNGVDHACVEPTASELEILKSIRNKYGIFRKQQLALKDLADGDLTFGQYLLKIDREGLCQNVTSEETAMAIRYNMLAWKESHKLIDQLAVEDYEANPDDIGKDKFPDWNPELVSLEEYNSKKDTWTLS